VPLVGGNFTLPLVKRLEVNGSYRHVDNSRAGKQDVWGVGGRWEIGAGLTLRGTISRNFRAPTLDQLIAPSQTRPTAIFYDPCSYTHINDGPAPDKRHANCSAAFAANPSWGPLNSFLDANENVEVALVTTGGNPDLKNEISDTKTFGAVWEPAYIRGLSVAVDVISLNLKDGLVQFSPQSFFTKCYDTSPQDSQACDSFTRNPDNGYIDSALSGYANAGYIKFRGETYKVHYALPLDRLFSVSSGVMRFGFEATHTSKYEESDTGFAVDAVRLDGTTSYPDWRMRFDLNYDRGPFSLFYSMSYYPAQKSGYYDTIETTANPRIGANSVSSASVSYRFEHLRLRAGVTNMFDKAPSFPTFTYGDALGRRFFVGANVTF
jgi:outer membrane receptor protein involved in Fe transport